MTREVRLTNPRHDWKRTGALIALGLLLLFFWNSPLLLPLKILVVLFHELGHAVAAWLTGGQVEAIGLSPAQGGHTLTRGGFRFLILNAGYLGSLLAGVGLLLATKNPRTSRGVAYALAAVMTIVGLVFVRPILSFGFAFTLVGAVSLAALARWASADMTHLLLRALGIFSILYALFDIRDDVFRAGPEAMSDAAMLAELTYIPAFVWGTGWLLVGVAVLWLLRHRLG